MGCIITLIAQFFLLYTGLFVLQTLNRLKVIDRKREERSWASVVESVFFVPMLCVLFLAARLQALQLSAGHPARHGLPQWWVRLGMVACTISVLWAALAQVVVVFATESQEEPRPKKGVLARCARMNKNFAMGLIYFCFAVVCLGACTMQVPEGASADGIIPRVSPAVLCTIFLTVMYFGVYLGLVCVSLANELGLLGQRLRFCQALEYLKSATTTIVFSPMLCALFLACQAHAMRLDPVHGHPQPWAHAAFYICCSCVVLHTLVVVAGTFADMREMQGEGGVRSKVRAKAVEVLSLACMTGLYGGAVTIIVSIYRFGSRPSSLSLHCVTILTVLYFAVSWANLSIPLVQRFTAKGSPRTGEPSGSEVYIGVLAKEAVAFCPKFCILFLGTQMRAGQLTDGLGAPQAWCQVTQCVATCCILLLAVIRMDVLLPDPGRASFLCTAAQYVCLALLYASAIAIVAALFLLTPDNATGWGAIAAAS